MTDLPSPEACLAIALQVIADLNLGQSQDSLTDQLAESVPILNALGLYDAADRVRSLITSPSPAGISEVANLRRALAESQTRERAFEAELLDVNRRMHAILRLPFKLRSVLPLDNAISEVEALVKNLGKQRRRNQRKAQTTLAKLAVAEGRKPKPDAIHMEAAIHRLAVEAGQDRATRKAAAERRRDPRSAMGRVFILVDALGLSGTKR